MATWYQSTRIHDDAMRVAQSVNESQAPLKYLTYGPDYLLRNHAVLALEVIVLYTVPWMSQRNLGGRAHG